MITKDKIFEILYNANDFVSGESLAKELNITRIAVNKHIKTLQANGIDIISSRKGYKYINSDTLTKETLKNKLLEKNIDLDIYIESVDSTNNSAKTIISNSPNCKNFLFIAPKQNKGRGRLDRVFVSNQGGVYMTLCYKANNLPITESLNIVLLTGLCVARVLERYTSNVTIKWPNDIFVNNKKISGILLESIISEYLVDKLILGIGINVNNEIPNELLDIATNLKSLGVNITREEIIVEVVSMLIKELENFEKNGFDSYKNEYISKSRTINTNVNIINGSKNINGIAKGLSSEGYLLVQTNEGIEKVIVGDVENK